MLADKIIYLLNNKSTRLELADAAFDTVNNYYSKEIMCRKYLDIYENLLRS